MPGWLMEIGTPNRLRICAIAGSNPAPGTISHLGAIYG